MFVARRAGYIPVNIPISPEKVTITTTSSIGILVMSIRSKPLEIERIDRPNESSFPEAKPINKPRNPPINPMVKASVINKS